MDLERLGRMIKQAQHRQHRALDVALSKVGTTVVQWDALRAIGRLAGASAHRLAVETFQTDQSFGTLAQRLLAQGLIARQAGAGRRIEHTLTPGGGQVLDVANRVAAQVRAEIFATLSEHEQRDLHTILRKLLGL